MDEFVLLAAVILGRIGTNHRGIEDYPFEIIPSRNEGREVISTYSVEESCWRLFAANLFCSLALWSMTPTEDLVHPPEKFQGQRWCVAVSYLSVAGFSAIFAAARNLIVEKPLVLLRMNVCACTSSFRRKKRKQRHLRAFGHVVQLVVVTFDNKQKIKVCHHRKK